MIFNSSLLPLILKKIPTLIVFSSNSGHFPIFPKLSKIKSDVGHHPQEAIVDFGNTYMIKEKTSDVS